MLRVLLSLLVLAVALPTQAQEESAPTASPVGSSTPEPAGKLLIEPSSARLLEPITIRVTEVPPEAPVFLESSLKDQRGRLWTARAEFRADETGTIDTSKQAPVSGTYSGVDPMGLFWSMVPDVPVEEQTTFWHTTLAPMVVKITATLPDGRQLEEFARRVVVDEGVTREEIREEGVVGNLFIPKGEGPHPGLIVLGGTEGGIPSDAYVAQFANAGFVSLGLAYYRTDGVPNQFASIPVEYFGNAAEWLKARPEVAPDRIGIVGSSTGGIAALLAASKYPAIRAAVTFAGGAVVFQSINPDPDGDPIQSTFSYRGEPVPFVAVTAPPPTPENLSSAYYLRVFLGSLYAAPAAEVNAAIIRLESANGPILMLAGQNDRLLGSAYLSALGYSRLTQSSFDKPYDLVSYNGAGHTLGANGLPGTPSTVARELLAGNTGYNYGGDPRNNALAHRHSWEAAIAFLKGHLGKPAAEEESSAPQTSEPTQAD